MLVLFTLSLLLAIVAVTDLSSAYLHRQSAMSMADGAALAAASSAPAASLYAERNRAYLPIDRRVAAAAVDDYLRSTGAYRRHRGMTVQVAVVGSSVRVALAVPFRLPVPVPGVARWSLVHGAASAAMPVY